MCNYPLCQAIALLIPPYVIQFWEEKVQQQRDIAVPHCVSTNASAAVGSCLLEPLLLAGKVLWPNSIWGVVWGWMVVLG